MSKMDLLTFQHRDGHGIGFSVAQAQMQAASTPLLHQAQAVAMQDDERFATRFATDFHVLPAKLFANAGSERLRDRFLGREPRSQEGGGTFVAETIRDLRRLENALEEPFPELLVSRLNAGHLDDVDAGSQDHVQGLAFRVSGRPGARASPPRNAESRPRRSSRIACHRGEHFLHGCVQANEDRAADDAVPDVQLDQMRDGLECGHVPDVQAMPGVDLQSKFMRLGGGRPESFQFPLPFALLLKMLGKSARVQLDELSADLRRGFDLRGVRGDKEADVDAGVVAAPACFAQGRLLAGGVQAAFGGYLLASLRDQANNVRPGVEGDLDDLRRIGHFQIEPGLQAPAQLGDVAVLDVASIFAEMRGDAMRPGGLAEERGCNRVRLSLGAAAVTRFAERRDVIDVDAKLEGHGRYGLPPGGGLVFGGEVALPAGLFVRVAAAPARVGEAWVGDRSSAGGISKLSGNPGVSSQAENVAISKPVKPR